jgi:uncharacterized zinc-type alcohol dehydrogenase-like protein
MINAYIANSAESPLETTTYEPKPLGAHDVEVKITHCGVCHSDLHLIKGHWRNPFPVVAGHEIVGEIVAVGSAVDEARMGQRVGVGWQDDACLDCEYCLGGEEQLCNHMQGTCTHGYGGFADAIRVDGRFAHPIPDALESAYAAPLLCAGITVYAPLKRYGAGAGKKVGIVSIGGLGHLGVQFAHHMGAHVTAFSSSDAKREQALELGADAYVNSNDATAMKATRRSFDLIVATTSADLNWMDYLKALRPNGVMVFVGAVPSPLTVSTNFLMTNQLTVTGGSIGGRKDMRTMLQLAADKGIKPYIETLPFDQINTALERLENNDVRYRFVLVNESA